MATVQSTQRSTTIGARIAPLSLSSVATVLLLTSFALGQVFVAAAGPAPAATLHFGDLKAAVQSGAVPTTAFQEAYFGWLAWTLVIVAIVLSVLSSALLRGWTTKAAGLVGLLGFVSSVVGNKGPLSWAQFVDQLPQLRAGAYCILLGFLLVVVAAVVAEVQARRHA